MLVNQFIFFVGSHSSSCIEFTDWETHTVVFPSVRRMKRLARKFLHCEYQESLPREEGSATLQFTIASSTKPEDRIAFLAAVSLYCTVKER